MTQPPDPPEIDELDELASAYLDGEATAAETARVHTDARLAARVEALRTVAAQVAAVGAPPAAQRDAAVAAALGALAAPDAPSAPVVSIDRARRLQRVGSIAAAVLLVVVGVAVIGALTTGDDDSDDAATATVEPPAADAAGEAGADVSEAADVDQTESAAEAAPVTTAATGPVVSLGDIADPTELADRVRDELEGADGRFDEGDTPVSRTESRAQRCAAAPPNEQVVLEAQADYDGASAFVIAYVDDDGEQRVVALAMSSCEVLANVVL